MNDSADWVVIGRFGRAHGIKGLITVHSFTEPRDNILNYTHWHGLFNKQWQLLNLTHLDKNDKHILAQVENYDDRQKVANLTNVEIAVKREQLPKLQPGDYYWHQLIGLEVIDKHNNKFGLVREIVSTGSNDVLVVEGEKRHLIPYITGQFVIKVDIPQQLIIVDWDIDF